MGTEQVVIIGVIAFVLGTLVGVVVYWLRRDDEGQVLDADTVLVPETMEVEVPCSQCLGVGFQEVEMNPSTTNPYEPRHTMTLPCGHCDDGMRVVEVCFWRVKHID